MAAELARQRRELTRAAPAFLQRARDERAQLAVDVGGSKLLDALHEQCAQLNRVLHRQGAPGERERFGDVALRKEDAAEITIDVGELRLQRQRAAILLYCFVPVSEAGERDPEIAMALRRRALQRERASIARRCFGEAALLQVNVSEREMSGHVVVAQL